ncbi:MAG: hypothetical protein IBX68_05505 [Dehalococcoidia bacterium]|nr:hypothetical protein [Dehalococcoidia bacterium]
MKEEESLRGIDPDESNGDVLEDSRQAARPGPRRGGVSFSRASRTSPPPSIERPLAPPPGSRLRGRSKAGESSSATPIAAGENLPGVLPGTWGGIQQGVLLQRSASDTGPAASGEVEEGAGSQVEGVVDPQAVAEMVYRMMRRELALERERAW